MSCPDARLTNDKPYKESDDDAIDGRSQPPERLQDPLLRGLAAFDESIPDDAPEPDIDEESGTDGGQAQQAEHEEKLRDVGFAIPVSPIVAIVGRENDDRKKALGQGRCKEVA